MHKVKSFFLLAAGLFLLTCLPESLSLDAEENDVRGLRKKKKKKQSSQHPSPSRSKKDDSKDVVTTSSNTGGGTTTTASSRNYARCQALRVELVKSAAYAQTMLEVGNTLALFRAGATGLISNGNLITTGIWQHQAISSAASVSWDRIKSNVHALVQDPHALILQAVDLAVASCEQSEDVEKEIGDIEDNFAIIGRGIFFHSGNKVGERLSEAMSEIFADRTRLQQGIMYPNYEIDLCYEDCSKLCRADFFEIGWLEDPQAATMLDVHFALINKSFPGNEMEQDFLRTYYRSIFQQLIAPPGGERARLDELVEFAENVEAWCAGKGGKCDSEQVEQWNSQCCDYLTCEHKSVEQDTLGFCRYWVYGTGSRYWTGIGTDEQCPIQGASAQEYDNYPYEGYDEQCFTTELEAECSLDRAFIAVDGAEYCGGEWTDEYFCNQGPVGFRAALLQNTCNKHGLQATNDRSGSYCLHMVQAGCIKDVDKGLQKRCPGRFTPETRLPW